MKDILPYLPESAPADVITRKVKRDVIVGIAPNVASSRLRKEESVRPPQVCCKTSETYPIIEPRRNTPV
jgi:hypothetical protein